MTKYQFIFLVIISLAGSVLLSCKHNPVLGDDNSDPNPNPVDTTMNPVDTTGNTNPCLPDVVYFKKMYFPFSDPTVLSVVVTIQFQQQMVLNWTVMRMW
ncbi:MAG: hypothetical protein IPM26_04320 [Saprospiraceae bacterium]|nr:hypothetical protein [Saprospiraceae bacterium]